MTVDVTIRQKGLFKKELKLSDISGRQLKYGKMDGERLDYDKLDERSTVFYHPKHIGRGFIIRWSPGERDRVDISLPLPATGEDIDDVFEAVKRICSCWKSSEIFIDDSPVLPVNLDAQCTEIKEKSLSVLHKICDNPKISYGPTLFCAFWPLTLGEEERSAFLHDTDLSGFRDYLHGRQSMHLFYAQPKFYRGKRMIGSYFITESVSSIVPLVPKVPYGTVDSQTGKVLKVDGWYVSFYSVSLKKSLGSIPYSDFAREMDLAAMEKYDATRVILNGMPLQKMEYLITYHSVLV